MPAPKHWTHQAEELEWILSYTILETISLDLPSETGAPESWTPKPKNPEPKSSDPETLCKPASLVLALGLILPTLSGPIGAATDAYMAAESRKAKRPGDPVSGACVRGLGACVQGTYTLVITLLLSKL